MMVGKLPRAVKHILALFASVRVMLLKQPRSLKPNRSIRSMGYGDSNANEKLLEKIFESALNPSVTTAPTDPFLREIQRCES